MCGCGCGGFGEGSLIFPVLGESADRMGSEPIMPAGCGVLFKESVGSGSGWLGTKGALGAEYTSGLVAAVGCCISCAGTPDSGTTEAGLGTLADGMLRIS